jgi:hypothetical protein
MDECNLPNKKTSIVIGRKVCRAAEKYVAVYDKMIASYEY